MNIIKLLKRIGGSVAIVLFVIVAAFYISNDETNILNDELRSVLPGQFVKLSNGVTHYELAGSKAAHLDLYTRSQDNFSESQIRCTGLPNPVHERRIWQSA